MHEVDRHLADWAARATAAQRRVGPTVNDLGGVAVVGAAAEHLALGPFLPYLLQAAAHQQRLTPDDNALLQEAVLRGLRQQQRHAAFAGAVDALVARPDLARALGAALPRLLIDRLYAAQGAGDDPAVALIGAEAAECLLQLCLAGVVRPAQLLGALDAITEDVAALPEPFAVRLPRMVGILDAHHRGAGLREALERFLALECTCRDAAFELALAHLRDALEARDHSSMIDHLVEVRRRLAELITHAAERLDARIYHAAVDAALTFSGPDAARRVPAAAAALHSALQHYRAWRYHTRAPAWAGPRQSDIAAWAELTTILNAAALHMADDDPWYGDGHTILTALLRAYTANRTVTVVKDTPTAAIVEALVIPAVEDTFLRQESRLRFLHYALDNDEALRSDPAALRLRAALHERTTPGEPPQAGLQAGGPGKERRWHLLAQTLTAAEFAHALQTMPASALDRLEVALRTHEDVIAAVTDPKVGRLMDRLIGQLQQSADWVPGIADSFQVLLEVTVRYAFLCYNIGRDLGGSYTEFLRLRDKAKKKQKVDEDLFHQHYYEVVKLSALFQVVDAEVINHAGGRVDVLVSFGPVRFNVECKIEEEDASEDNLRKYAAQPSEYQNTNASFAILLVLDKTEHAEGTVNLFDSIWIENVQQPGQSEACQVVTIRIPGGRENPSLLQTPAR
ncbi:hypothetical protein [Planobispora takensis]|uniref:Uncharacterized protein n=1 Tax=Planobispora takensis TaxID=1367882 RepID=A0A8J3SUC9_9ACTN|nr:hypothetical protein [Planobispora takensis]GIH99171.1 hypothetical protein Pta02_11800 [Planobispora takensis]